MSVGQFAVGAGYALLIKESFRDDKSGRLDLHASHLVDPKRLDTLQLNPFKPEPLWYGKC